MKRFTLAAGATVLSILLAAYASSSKTAGTAPASASDAASPRRRNGAIGGRPDCHQALCVLRDGDLEAGQKVTVTNQDSAPHARTDTKTRLFDTDNLEGIAGAGTFTAPTKSGSHPFGCRCYPGM